MQHRYVRAAFMVTLLPLLCGAAGCTLSKQSPPTTLTGPSAILLPLVVTATPDVLARDGSSAATITITTRDQAGQPASRRVVLSATAGVLSATSLVTDAAGHGSVVFTAPPVNPAVSSAVVTVTQQGTDPVSNPDVSNNLTITLVGAPGPTAPAITASTTTPTQFDLVTFSGSASLSGSTCTSSCTFAWDFGDGATATGQTVTHRYQSVGTFTVTLTVSTAAGTSASTTTSVTVGAQTGLTAAITFSPTNPVQDQVVFFDGNGSKSPDGSAITSYTWDFGNGATATGATATTSYSTVNTFTVRLTVTDSAGRTATTTTTVTVTKK